MGSTMQRSEDGRTAQKGRTRAALLEAARLLMDRGEVVTVTAAAEAAGISKATAYRYFSDPQALVIEAMLDARMQPVEEILGDATDARERVQRIRHFLFDLVRDQEPQFRKFLASTQEFWLANGGGAGVLLRGRRRLPMYRTALAPVADQLGPEALDRLVAMLAATSGMESFLPLKDICGLELAAADATAKAITDAILDRFLPGPG
jgi:AcrR family transcriptional regulator